MITEESNSEKPDLAIYSNRAEMSDKPSKSQNYDAVNQQTSVTEGGDDPEMYSLKKKSRKPACCDKMILR